MGMTNLKHYFEIVPMAENKNVKNKLAFQKMKITFSQKIQMGGLLQ